MMDDRGMGGVDSQWGRMRDVVDKAYKPEYTKLRRAITLKLISELGVSLAETARRLGISTSGVAQILRRSEGV
jgi:hypothetical protein